MPTSEMDELALRDAGVGSCGGGGFEFFGVRGPHVLHPPFQFENAPVAALTKTLLLLLQLLLRIKTVRRYGTNKGQTLAFRFHHVHADVPAHGKCPPLTFHRRGLTRKHLHGRGAPTHHLFLFGSIVRIVVVVAAAAVVLLERAAVR